MTKSRVVKTEYIEYFGNCPNCNKEQTSRYKQGVDILCYECLRNAKLDMVIEIVDNAEEIIKYIENYIPYSKCVEEKSIVVRDNELCIKVNDDTTLVIEYDTYDEQYYIKLK